ncbi:hypothetical protein HID58_064630 [Brassica napus]|uniref:DUF4283 domain-containing protein n=1 Tax=Brassica napus TaxID=3708 RepID=A0ABQ7ZAV4_BRANA|nr:hypothetical protein HID58_064630 [Brassica napus]
MGLRSSHMADIKGKGILYEDDDAPIILMDQDDTLIANEFSLSLIGNILNPKKQNVEKLLQKMPSQWGMANRITANDLGNGKFLINFSSKEDLSSVLRQGPFHFNFCINDELNGPIEHQGIGSGDGKTAKRLASTIVTPSRSGHDMEENVTKRAKGLTRSLSFTSLSEKEPAATDGDNQIIGALNDMDIEDQQEEEVMECDAPDEDLLGMELKEMEDTAARHDANMKTTCQDDNVNEAKALKNSKQGTRANVPLGFQSKKFELP